MSPISDRDEPYERWCSAWGYARRRSGRIPYAHAIGVDCSVWPWCKGPEITLRDAAVGGRDDGCADLLRARQLLYCAQGRYILRRDSDATWTQVADFGVGVAVLNVTVFT